MENITENMPVVLCFLFIAVAWFVYRKAFVDRLNNAEAYSEDIINVLEEIRDELKELNKNNSIK